MLSDLFETCISLVVPVDIGHGDDDAVTYGVSISEAECSDGFLCIAYERKKEP